jgi:hypothetical protein
MLAASHVGRREFVIFSTATIVRPTVNIGTGTRCWVVDPSRARVDIALNPRIKPWYDVVPPAVAG